MTTSDETAPDAKPLMSYTDLISLALSFNSRLDTLWQRIIYTHAAIVGVMVFFATTDVSFLIPRLLVFFFYTLNIGITLTAITESYSGLRAALDDMQSFPRDAAITNTQGWVLGRSYHRHAGRRIVALGLIWLVLGYLLLYPVRGDIVQGWGPVQSGLQQVPVE
ncbi:MAG: hypothetical protein AAF891_09145 [Pseudomonadota bacterium]